MCLCNFRTIYHSRERRFTPFSLTATFVCWYTRLFFEAGIFRYDQSRRQRNRHSENLKLIFSQSIIGNWSIEIAVDVEWKSLKDGAKIDDEKASRVFLGVLLKLWLLNWMDRCFYHYIFTQWICCYYRQIRDLEYWSLILFIYGLVLSPIY